MKKIFNKFTKILLLVAMVISDLMSPIKVFADEIEAVTPEKGDVGINETVSNEGSVTVTKGSIENPGDVMVTKTVKKNGEGKFTVEFEVKGKDAESTTSVQKPIYAVVVFDRSGSMCSDAEDIFGICHVGRSDKWNSAVAGAKTFATTLLGNFSNAKLALVAFSTRVNTLRNFESANFDSVNFGSPDGGTNLHAGLIEANRLLSDSSIPENAKKYVVIISDGEPTLYIDDNGNSAGPGSSTDKDVYDNTKSMDDTIKEYAEVFSIGYSLPNGEVYNNMTAAQILENMATEDNTSEEDYVRHYYDSNPEEVAAAFSDIATSISKVNAGTGATINDNIGASFSVDASSSSLITVIGDSVSNTSTFDITEEGTKISFDVEINGDEADGWVNVNEGFTLTYTDANGEEKTITYGANEPQPQVYWERNKYNYTVNYYKDSIEAGNEVGEPFVGEAEFSTIITENDVNKNLRLSEAGEGYEYNSIENTPLTITDNEDNNVINVLYTLKKFDYTVNYYYDGVKDNDKSYEVEDVTYGTVVNANELYFANTDEYSLDTENSTSGNVTINENGIVINIYYNKNSYDYSVHYNFNNEEDNTFAYNSAALYGTELFAGNYYLSSEDLSTKYSDYFLDPVDPGKSKNNETITVGNKENRLDIFYINTNFKSDESITKTATTDGNKVTSSNQVINYKVNYSTTINNVRDGDTVTTTFTDTLPYKATVSNLTEGCSYDGDKTITCTFTDTASEFKSEYTVTKEAEYSVVYEDFADISSSSNPKLINTVNGQTTVTSGDIVKETNGVTDTAEIDVEIIGKLIVHHYEKDENGNDVSVYSDERTEAPVGTSYETNYRTDIIGYTVDTDNMPTNKDGKYAEGTTEVTYYYVRKNGIIEDTDADKTGPESVSSINDVFEYTVKGTATIKDYVGTYKVKVTDTLPFSIDTEKSTLDDRCTYDGDKTITCISEEKTVDKNSYDENGEFKVEEEFTLKLVFVGINTETIKNTAKVEIILDNNSDTDTDTTETTIEKGNAKAIYVEKDNEDNVLAPEEQANGTGLVGSEYTTDAKEIFGYDLVGEPENKNGTYTKEDIVVKYLYAKKVGFIDAPSVVKEGPTYVTSIDSIFNYTLKVDTKIKDYVGDATLTVTDILPYNIDMNKSKVDKRCTYDGNLTITCTVNYNDIKEANYNSDKEYVVSEKFDLQLVFIGIKDGKVTNKVNAIIDLDNNSNNGKDKVTTEVKQGNVKATYTTTDGEELAKEVITSGIGGSEYTTEAKEFFGYHLTEMPKNNEGTYVAEKEILVEYIYELNEGEITNNKVTKEGPEIISDVNDFTEYVFTYNGTVKDYIGKATLTLTDILPYEIYRASYNDRCDYDSENNTFTCIVEYDISEDDYEVNEDGEKVFNIHEEFYLSVIYGEIDSDVITNKVDSKLELRKVYEDSESSVDSKVLKGDLLVSYVDEEGNVLDSYSITDYAGAYYETEEREFEGYTFKSSSDNTEGFLIANETVYVEYVYSKNIGTYEELPPQTGIEDTSASYITYLLMLIGLLFVGKKTKESN